MIKTFQNTKYNINNFSLLLKNDVVQEICSAQFENSLILIKKAPSLFLHSLQSCKVLFLNSNNHFPHECYFSTLTLKSLCSTASSNCKNSVEDISPFQFCKTVGMALSFTKVTQVTNVSCIMLLFYHTYIHFLLCFKVKVQL